MCSRLQCDETLRYSSKGLLHRFRRRRQLLLQNDLACSIHYAVERPAIPEIQTDRQLLLPENVVLEYLYSASLFHSRSPFVALRARRPLGAYRIPPETGLLIPSGKRDYRRLGIRQKASFREAIDWAPPRQGRKKVAPRLLEE